MNWGELIINSTVFITASGTTFLSWQAADKAIRRRMINKRLMPVKGKIKQQEPPKIPDSILNITVKLGRMASPKDTDEVSSTSQRLSWAGFRKEDAVIYFYGIKFGLGVLLSGIFLILGILSGSLSTKTPILLFLPFGIGYFTPELILKKKIEKRIQQIFQELPDTLDLLEVCLKAGLGFNYALYRVAGELTEISPVLSAEFGRYFLETKAGINREEALHNLVERNGSDPLKKVVNVLIQSLKIGGDIAQALNVYTDTMRKERMQMAEEQGAKLSSKLTLPLVVFILPALMLIILGPVIINFLEIVRQGF